MKSYGSLTIKVIFWINEHWFIEVEYRRSKLLKTENSLNPQSITFQITANLDHRFPKLEGLFTMHYPHTSLSSLFERIVVKLHSFLGNLSDISNILPFIMASTKQIVLGVVLQKEHTALTMKQKEDILQKSDMSVSVPTPSFLWVRLSYSILNFLCTVLN